MTQTPETCHSPDTISSKAGSKGDQVANTADIAAQAGVRVLDLSNLLKHAFISGRESAGAASSFHAEAWVEYDPEPCAAYQRISAALADFAARGVQEPVGWKYRLKGLTLWNYYKGPKFNLPKPEDFELEPVYQARILAAIEPQAVAEPVGEIADAVLNWMVKFDLLDAGNEYRAADVLAVLGDLAPVTASDERAVEATVDALLSLRDQIMRGKRCTTDSGPALKPVIEASKLHILDDAANELERLAALAAAPKAQPVQGWQTMDSAPPNRIRVAQDADGFWTCREAVSGSQEYVRVDIFETVDKAERATFEISLRLLRERDQWQELAILALPYLEEAAGDRAYKQGTVRSLINRIKLAHNTISPLPAGPSFKGGDAA